MRREYQELKIEIITMSVWFAIISGIIEGLMFLVFQQFGRIMGVSLEILWISPLVNFVIFGVVGLGLVIVDRILPNLPVEMFAVFIFTLLTILDWLTIAFMERFEPYAIIIFSIGLSVVFLRWYQKHGRKLQYLIRRTVPWLAVFVIVLLVVIQGGSWLFEKIAIANLPSGISNSPNVILIVVDTLRADHLSVYGYPRDTSPNIDRFASQGVLFQNAIAPATNSLPSHVSIFSGLYPHSHGTEWNTPLAYRDGSFPTLAEALRSDGYVTAGFSANLFWVTSAYGFNRGFIHFEDYFRSVGDMILRTLYGRLFEKFALQRLGFEDIPARRHAADINRSVFSWFDSEKKNPFFLFINYIDVHDPYLPPEPYRSKFSKTENPGGILNCGVGRCDPTLTADQLQSEKDAYDGAISYVDAQINQLLTGLRQRGLLDNTLIIITSDHGEAFDEHGMYLHDNSLYREVIHVPLILIWPGHLPENVQIAQPVSIAALPATIVDLLGEKGQNVFSIQSIRPLWEDNKAAANWPYPLSEIAGRPWMPDNYPVHNGWVKSLVSPQWQFVKNENLPDELYNWQADVLEKNNLAQQPDMQSEILAFTAKLNEDLSLVR
jgi:arylsulfatase A-like enzyme